MSFRTLFFVSSILLTRQQYMSHSGLQERAGKQLQRHFNALRQTGTRWLNTIYIVAGLMLINISPVAAESIYVNAQLAFTRPEQSSSGLAAVVAVGVPVPERKNVFLEGELSSTLVDPKQHSMGLSYTQLGGYGVYQRLINERFALHGKAGLLYQYSKIEQSDSEGGAGIAFGIGATIHQSRDMSYLLELSMVQAKLDINYISAGIRYRFR